MGIGTLWTETDVRDGRWYLHEGRMPAGIMIESGQADLLLISWLGVDFLNRGERVYRLLGCELTYHGELPRAGRHARYEIHVDGHAQPGRRPAVLLPLRLLRRTASCASRVRNGQAGFFTDEELASRPASSGTRGREPTAAPTRARRAGGRRATQRSLRPPSEIAPSPTGDASRLLRPRLRARRDAHAHAARSRAAGCVSSTR